jgi:hypothetical protein
MNWRGKPLVSHQQEMQAINITRDQLHGEWNYPNQQQPP